MAVSDVVWQSLINGAYVAIGAAVVAYFKFKLDAMALTQKEHLTSQDVKLAHIDTVAKETVEQVHVIEKATNSMKDALVLATKEAGIAKGKEQGRQAERDEYPSGRPGEGPDAIPLKEGETPVVIVGTIKPKEVK